MNRLIRLCLLIVLCSGASELLAQETELNTENWMQVEGEGFRISFPPEWDFDQEGSMGTEFIIFSPPGSLQDKFRENLNLVVQDVADMDLSLQDYTELSVRQIETMLTDAEILSSSIGELNGTTYSDLVYKGSMGQMNLFFYQRYLLWNGKAYVLTFTTEQNTKKEYLPIGESLMASFHFIED